MKRKLFDTTKIVDYYKQLTKIILKRGKYGVVWWRVEGVKAGSMLQFRGRRKAPTV